MLRSFRCGRCRAADRAVRSPMPAWPRRPETRSGLGPSPRCDRRSRTRSRLRQSHASRAQCTRTWSAMDCTVSTPRRMAQAMDSPAPHTSLRKLADPRVWASEPRNRKLRHRDQPGSSPLVAAARTSASRSPMRPRRREMSRSLSARISRRRRRRRSGVRWTTRSSRSSAHLLGPEELGRQDRQNQDGHEQHRDAEGPLQALIEVLVRPPPAEPRQPDAGPRRVGRLGDAEGGDQPEQEQAPSRRPGEVRPAPIAHQGVD